MAKRAQAKEEIDVHNCRSGAATCDDLWMTDERDLVLFDPWVDLRKGGVDEAARRDALTAELRAEVAIGHPLHGVDVAAIGFSTARDDVLFRLADGRWAVVHLTYARPEKPPWPHTTFLNSVAAVEAACTEDEV